MDGLSRLEYRGYDSAGVALTHGLEDDGSELTVVKAVGKLTNLEAALAETPTQPCRSAIGHTRWATHGLSLIHI